MRRLLSSLSGLCLLCVACDGAAPATDGGLDAGPSVATDLRPEVPSISRDVALIDDGAHFTRPFVPGHRTTMDGRVGIRVQGAPPGTRALRENLSFYLFAPERLREPLLTGPNGAEILADPEPFDVPFPPGLDPAATRTGHHAICDATQEHAVPGERPNPFPCGPGDAHDCYAITVISATTAGIGAQLWGTPARVEIGAPKTAGAHIVSVELGEPVAGAMIPLSVDWTEPAVTMDGRLLTGRFGLIPRNWTHPETGEVFTRPYDLAYSVLPEDAAPCDVTGWTAFHPMSHAPYDPAMVGRYGLAAYPFRDTEGNPIPDGEDMGGTYPWVDRRGTNVFMAGVPGRIVEQSETRYPRRCATPGCESFQENFDWDRGFMVAGLWTHGKLVHLDAMINNVDWAVGVTPAAHWMVELYRTPSGEPFEVRFGAGRFIDAVRAAGGPYPPGYTHNANILDSLESLFAYHAATRTITPRDVVWLMNTGVASDEVAFDDFLDLNAFIVSNMQASITQRYGRRGDSLAVPHHHNGQVRRLEIPVPLAERYVLDPDADEEIHLQNAATSLRWRVPAYGLVAAGTARVEPVALGGVRGRGFWLTGDNAIRYAIDAQPRAVREADWYFGMFVDPRDAEGALRTLATFPDGSAIRLVGRASLEYAIGGRVVHTAALPPWTGWTHLAVLATDGLRRITLHVDGVAYDRFESDTPLFEPSEGELVIGRAASGDGPGFRGWIDELVMLAYAPDVEARCNQANGTLVRVVEHPALAAVAEGHPAWAHDEIAAAAGLAPGARFACHHGYRRDYAAHELNVPAGTEPVREAIHFPEGPLRAGAPRPDSTDNAFCATCHEESGRGGLSMAALAYDATTMAEDDRRRQPHQSPRRVFGNVPASWIAPGPGPGGPPAALVAPPEGLLIDRWTLPAAP